MRRLLPILAMLAFAAPASAQVPTGEQPVDPYAQTNANAGSAPFTGEEMLRAFHGREGIGRIVDDLVDRAVADPRISDIFQNQDLVRLRRTLKEQFCFLLAGGCAYSGRDMASAHANMGVRRSDFNALVEDLQQAMDKEGVSFRAQNRLLAKLAPMERTTVTR